MNWMKDFYPTPTHLALEMLKDVDFQTVETVLEPSAGKGDLCETVVLKMDAASYAAKDKCRKCIDCIEISPELQNALMGKGYRVMHDDFLTYETAKRYDLIVMNPPFSEGDRHLLRALDLMKHGGYIACILNAETLRNPHTERRKELCRRLQNANAQIVFKTGAFVDAERKTGVEIAIIRLSIPKVKCQSNILTDLQKAREVSEAKVKAAANIANHDIAASLIDQYKYEASVGLALIDEYNALKPYIMLDEGSVYDKPMLELHVNKQDASANEYLQELRKKYWKALFKSSTFRDTYTSNLMDDYISSISKLVDYEFSEYNILTMRAALGARMIGGVEQTIIAMFDKLSCVYHYDEQTQSFNHHGSEHAKNVHYYNGWKTNKSWYVNHRVVIPFYGVWNDWNGNFRPTDYKTIRELGDIEKCFAYLDGGRTEAIDLSARLHTAELEGVTKKIELRYFYVTFYKKGTAHLEFKNKDLLKKFNIFGSQRRGWLPPSYGKQHYADMDEPAKAVIDSFQGAEDYEATLADADYFIADSARLLELGA